MSHATGSRTRRASFWILLILLTAAGIELASHAVIRASRGALAEPIRRRADIYAEQTRLLATLLDTAAGRRDLVDTALGWRYRPGFRGPGDRVNSAGLRGRREYAPGRADDRVRIAAFGDSFVYGTEVADTAAWTARMEQRVPGLDVLNYGVGGYGIDQAFLRYLAEGARFAPDVVIVGFVPVNLRRVVNVYRRFLSTLEFPLVKPRYRLTAGGALQLQRDHVPDHAGYGRWLARPETVRALGALDAWYEPAVYEHPLYDWSATLRLATAVRTRLARRYWNPDRLVVDGVFNPRAPAFTLQLALMQVFADSTAERGTEVVFLLFPDVESVERLLGGVSPVYAPLEERLRARGHRVLDAGPALARRARAGGAAKLFRSGGHYSPEGNQAVADTVLAYLRTHALAMRGS